MIIGIRLEEDTKCDQICKNIQKLISLYQVDNPDLKDTILTIKINKVAYTIDDSKNTMSLEYKSL